MSISLGQSMSISLTHIKQTSLRSGGTNELHKVKSLVAISPISFQRAKICLQSGLFAAELGLFAGFPDPPEAAEAWPEVTCSEEAISGFNDIEDDVEAIGRRKNSLV